MTDGEIRRRMEIALKAESAIEDWAKQSLPLLRDAMKTYQAHCEIEWRKTQRELVVMAEQKDALSREVVKLRRQIAEIKETLAIRE